MKIFLLLFAGAIAGAHELGTTRVAVEFRDSQSYHVEITTDATALLEKLETIAGRPQSQETAAPRVEALLKNYTETFRQRLYLAFDQQLQQPAIAIAVTPQPDAARATIHLTGPIPPSARRFTWAYAWTFATYSLSLRGAPASAPLTLWLEGGQKTNPIDFHALGKPPLLSFAWRYLTLGFTHIVPHGLDHMLFVLGIFLLTLGLRSLLLQVTAFTLAHSITLGLSMYGVFTLPAGVVEPLIAVSIAYVAIENIFRPRLHPWRLALVFAFGLLHGLGFAGALQETGLPRTDFFTALLSFNLGVEAGQLSVIALAYVLLGWRLSRFQWYRTRIAVPASAAIACVAVYWTVERLF